MALHHLDSNESSGTRPASLRPVGSWPEMVIRLSPEFPPRAVIVASNDLDEARLRQALNSKQLIIDVAQLIQQEAA